MQTVLWTLRSPCSWRSGDELVAEGGRRFSVVCIYGENPKDQAKFHFDGVEAIKISFQDLCSLELVSTCYGKLCDLGETPWLLEARKMMAEGVIHFRPGAIRHLAIYFDDGPAYEFLCRSYSVDDPPPTTEVVPTEESS